MIKASESVVGEARGCSVDEVKALRGKKSTVTCVNRVVTLA
jgi:hypothetical protein